MSVSKKVVGVLLIATMVLAACGCSCSKKTTSAQMEYNPLDYVTLGQYEGVTVQLNSVDYEVTEEKIQAEMMSMLKDTDFVADDSATVVKKDSIVNVDYDGKINGVTIEGAKDEDVWIDVAKNSNASSGTKYIEGFSNGIQGARVGTRAEYEVKFPDNYANKDLAGKTVLFAFRVNKIAKPVSDMLTDQYVKEHSDGYTSVAALREQATKNVEEANKISKDADLATKVNEVVLSNCVVNSLPEEAFQKRYEEELKVYEDAADAVGESFKEKVQEYYGLSYDEFKQQLKSEVEKDFKEQLVYEAIAKQQNITVDDEGYKLFCELYDTKNGFTTLDALYKHFSPDGTVEGGKAYMEKQYLIDKARKYCVDKANVVYV